MERVISLSTVNHECRALRSFLGRAVTQGYFSKNPFDGVKIPKPDNTVPHILMPNHLRQLLAASNPALQRSIKILVTLGLRVSEYLNTQWKNLDMRNRILYVRENKDTGFQVKTHWQRVVPVPAQLVNILGKPGMPDDLICGKNGAGLTCNYDWIQRAFRRACKRAKLENFTIHDLRATAATMMAASKSNYSAYKILSIFGWKDLQTSLKYISVSSVLFLKRRQINLLPWQG